MAWSRVCIELVETEQEATENAIKQMFLRLSSAKMDNRPQKIIMQYQLELNNGNKLFKQHSG